MQSRWQNNPNQISKACWKNLQSFIGTKFKDIYHLYMMYVQHTFISNH